MPPRSTRHRKTTKKASSYSRRDPITLPERQVQLLWLPTIESGFAAQGGQPTSYLLTNQPLRAGRGARRRRPEQPTSYLTNQPLRRNRAVPWRLVLSFLQYGHAVRTNRAIKAEFDFDERPGAELSAAAQPGDPGAGRGVCSSLLAGSRVAGEELSRAAVPATRVPRRAVHTPRHRQGLSHGMSRFHCLRT